jgi:polar amino acid transport system substrate-binding protein
MRIQRLRRAFALGAILTIVAAACGTETTSSPGTTGPTGPTGGDTGVCASVDTTTGDALAKICESGTLRVATDQKYKPQSWFDVKSNTWKGFDVDVATEIANRLGVAVDIQHQDWGIVTAGSWNDRWDINVGSMTDTIEREGLFYFTPAYYYTPAGVAVSGDNTTYTAIGDLAGKNICAGEQTTYESYLRGELVLGGGAPPFEYQIDDPRVTTYKTDTDALDQLDLGDGVRCDAAISAVPTIQSYMDDGGNMKLLGDPIFFEPLSIALDRNDPVDNQSLVDAVSQIIEDMHADGTLTSLSMNWYETDLTMATGM